MTVFLLVLGAFLLPLLLYSPEPENLREVKHSDLAVRIRRKCGTITLGAILIIVAAITFDPVALKILPEWEALLGLSRQGVFNYGFIFQLITNSFVHINLFHLLCNLSVLMLLSVYEWRVGVKRFLAVFLIAAIGASVVDLIVISEQSISLGASAGICGLAAAYFLDFENISRRDWMFGIGLVLLLVGVYSLGGNDKANLGASVDWIAHLAGALTGAIYVRLFSCKFNLTSSSEVNGARVD